MLVPLWTQDWLALLLTLFGGLQLIFELKLHMKASYNRILFKQEGMRSAWEYPFAVAGINVSFMLIQMLDLYSGQWRKISCIK